MSHLKKNFPHSGILTLMRGTTELRVARYTTKDRRTNLIQMWLTDIKKLPSTENYYFIINPETL